jgi:rsbT co-antagonist protein RsbR
MSKAPRDASQDALPADNPELRAQAAELTREVERLGREVEELSRWRMLAQATLDASPNMINVRGLDHRYVIINEAFARYVGVSSSQILGKEDADFFPPALIEELRVYERQVVSTLQVSEGELQVPRPDGAHTYATRRFPVLTPSGEVIAVGGITADMTARRRAEASLRESQTLLQAVLDNSSSIIIVFDREGRYLVVNQQFERALQRPAKDIVGKTAFDFFAPEDASRITSVHTRVFATGEPLETEDPIQTAEGVRIFLSSTFPLRDAEGGVYAACGLVTDITDRKRQEEERARHREEVIQAQESALRELSTPLIPLAEGVVMMPLIGSIDSVRARQVLETLLEGTARHQASVAILDITGVPNVDADVAHALIGAAKAVQLLGATTVLTGIRPEVARTLTELNIDLSGIVTQGSLESGIAFALGRKERQALR